MQVDDEIIYDKHEKGFGGIGYLSTPKNRPL